MLEEFLTATYQDTPFGYESLDASLEDEIRTLLLGTAGGHCRGQLPRGRSTGTDSGSRATDRGGPAHA